MVHLWENFQSLGMWCDPAMRGSIDPKHKQMIKHIVETIFLMTKHFGEQPSVRFSGFGQLPVVAWLLTREMCGDAPVPFRDQQCAPSPQAKLVGAPAGSPTTFTTPYYDGQRVPHIELGGINGCDAISIRSLTHLDDKVRDDFNRAWFKLNFPNGKPKDLPEPAECWMESEFGTSHAIGEFIANSMQWGGKAKEKAMKEVINL